MASSNCYSSLYPFPIDLNEDDQQHQHQLLSFKTQPPPPPSSSSSSSSSPLTCPSFFNQTVIQEPAGYYQRESQQFQEQEDLVKKYVPQDGPLESDTGLKLSLWKTEERFGSPQNHDSGSSTWMSSKMRKMTSSDHGDLSNSSRPKFEDQKLQPSPSANNSIDSSYNNNNNNSTIRVCADCNTTKTPLWRSGPRGPKSLCNACGIRQRKARRAMAAAAAAAANGSVVTAETTPSMKGKVEHKGKRLKMNKKCKLSSQPQGRKKLCFEDLRMILSKNSAFHGVFPQDEKEAAVLLMALSYGLVHG